MTRVTTFLAMAIPVAALISGAALTLPVAEARAQAAASGDAEIPSEATVRALQQALKDQGIEVEVDGAMNERTRSAIREFQGRHHLPVTGEADKATLDKLGVATAAAGRQQMPDPRGGGPGMGPGMMGGQMMGQGAMTGGAMGPGMMRPDMMGPQMMGPQMMGPQMMGPQMMGPDMMGRGMADDMPFPMARDRMTRSEMSGPRMRRDGMTVVPIIHLSIEEVRHYFEHWIAATGNKRLKVGDVEEVDEEGIRVDIVTGDDSLVDRLEVDRHSGRMTRIE